MAGQMIEPSVSIIFTCSFAFHVEARLLLQDAFFVGGLAVPVPSLSGFSTAAACKDPDFSIYIFEQGSKADIKVSFDMLTTTVRCFSSWGRGGGKRVKSRG